mgnify:CR=1 FL=1
MSTIYDVANVKGFIRMCNDGWLQAGMSATAAT